MKTHKLSENNCPACYKKLDAASNAYDDEDDRAPIVGDMTICIYCSEILEFTSASALKVANLTTLPSHEALRLLDLSNQVSRSRSRRNRNEH